MGPRKTGLSSFLGFIVVSGLSHVNMRSINLDNHHLPLLCFWVVDKTLLVLQHIHARRDSHFRKKYADNSKAQDNKEIGGD